LFGGNPSTGRLLHFVRNDGSGGIMTVISHLLSLDRFAIHERAHDLQRYSGRLALFFRTLQSSQAIGLVIVLER
jgi:hypothetical protein